MSNFIIKAASKYVSKLEDSIQMNLEMAWCAMFSFNLTRSQTSIKIFAWSCLEYIALWPPQREHIIMLPLDLWTYARTYYCYNYVWPTRPSFKYYILELMHKSLKKNAYIVKMDFELVSTYFDIRPEIVHNQMLQSGWSRERCSQ